MCTFAFYLLSAGLLSSSRPNIAVTASLRMFGEHWAWLNIARLDFGSDEEILTLVLISGGRALHMCHAGAAPVTSDMYIPLRVQWRIIDYIIDNSLIT